MIWREREREWERESAKARREVELERKGGRMTHRVMLGSLIGTVEGEGEETTALSDLEVHRVVSHC